MKKKLNVLVVLLLILSSSIFAEVKLPAIFGDNMVLQRQSSVWIWGKATQNSVVTISSTWDKKTYSTTVGNDSTWKIKVSTPKAGGPYQLRISDGKELTIDNILIGEVWICSGQSNMEMPMKGFKVRDKIQPVLNADSAILKSTNPLIRLFTVAKSTSLNPENDFKGNWKLCEPQNVSEFSATAYFFGLKLYELLKIPVGVVNSSWGGTIIEPWIGKNGYKDVDFVKLPTDSFINKKQPHQTPTALFNAMIHPMVGFGMRGAIWYQGESNRNNPNDYLKLLPKMVQNWRNEWGIGNFPFYYVQIAPYFYGATALNSAYLREAQLKASSIIPNSGMACIMDVGEKDCIHPANKEVAGNRLAYHALTNTYKMKGIVAKSPAMKKMKISKGVVQLTFSNAPNGLTSNRKELACFEVADSSKVFYPANATIKKNVITITSTNVVNPVGVRYAFKDFVVGDLFSAEGIPVSSFRTDTWK